MASAARKNEYIYAPSKVYSYSRAATAEALPQQEPQIVKKLYSLPIVVLFLIVVPLFISFNGILKLSQFE